MRLRDIQNTLQENIRNLQLQITGIDPHNQKINGIVKFLESFKHIEKTGIFKADIQKIKETESVLFAKIDSITLPKKESDKLNGHIQSLRNKINVLNTVLSELLPKQEEKTLSIKSPPINDLKELSSVSEQLDKIFDQLIVNDHVQGKSKLQNFDTGSEWIEIIFNTTKALGIIVSVIYSVIFKRENIKNQELLQVVRNREITNDLYESFGKQLQQQTDNLLRGQVQHIMEEAGADADDHEYSERIKYCINETAELIDKGLQFFPSTQSPNDIKNKLPDFSKSKIEEMLPKVKELPDVADESDEENEG